MRSQLFHDFDAFAASVRDVDSKMLLRNPGKRVWFTCSVDLGPIDVQMGRLASGNIAQGELRSEGYLIYLPLTDGTEYVVNGTVMQPGTVCVMEPGSEFCISTAEEHDWLAVFVPTPLLQDAFANGLNEPASAWARVTSPNLQLAQKFRKAGYQVLSAAASYQQFESSPAAARAAEVLRSQVAEMIGMPTPPDAPHEGRPRIARHKIITCCLDLIEQRTNHHVSLRELLQAADVSERTLRTAFNEYFGVTPGKYLQLRQLHRIRRALRVADPREATVTGILAEHGEWALSRFAARYKRHFGELPSETLKKR